MNSKNENNAVVKIDKDLLKEIDKFIEKSNFVYSNKKQVVNLAIIDFLKLNKFKESKKKRK